ncbi:MAG: cadmium-translocating P-type ATPase [Bacilli bacterium]|nr:cadmium-translocating P-type ATPase [Bacilli bacterium]
MIKKKYHISGFDCPNCAHKSEEHLSKHEKIDSCHIDFSTNKMYVTYKKEQLSVQEIADIIAQVESDPLDIRDLDEKTNKKIYHISGFDCPNCAHKSEVHLNNQAAIENCHIDFSTNKMYITFKDKELSVNEIKALIAQVESDPLDIHEIGNKKAEETPKLFTKSMWFLLARVVFAVIVMVLNMTVFHHFDETGWIRFAIYTFTSLLLVYDIFWRVLVHIRHMRNIIDHNLLISITIVATTALAVIYLVNNNAEMGVDRAMEGMMVVGLFQVGQIIERIATNRSKLAVMNAIQLRVEYANLLKNGEVTKVDPEQLEINDNVVVSAGEMIPVDGEVIEGSAYVDKSSLTGEFVPVLADKENKEVLAGCLVKNGSITLRVNRKYEDSAVAKIIDLISNSGEKKSKADEFIGKFAKWYTPIIVLLAILVFVVGGAISRLWDEWLIRGLEILVTGCPCAIVISVPLAYFAGIGLASKKGIVIKGTNYLDEINNINKVVTDKTGTLTHGVFTISKVCASKDSSEKELLEALYAAESLSNHPIAKAICHDVDIKSLAAKQKDYQEIAGFGVKTTYDGEHISAGHIGFINQNGLNVERADENGTIIYCQKDGRYLGYVVLNDEVKKEAYQMVSLLHKEKMAVVLLTGDKKENADALQKELNLDRVYSELTPEDKTFILEQEMLDNKGNVAFLGDGINDAPSIMRSDVGFAMGAIGSDIAVENADVVIMNDDPAKVYEAVKIARIARHTAIFNIAFALLVKAVVAILVMIPTISIPMMIPVIADTGLTVVLVLNSLLILYRKIRK